MVLEWRDQQRKTAPMTTKFFNDTAERSIELTRVYQERNFKWFGEEVGTVPVWNKETAQYDRVIYPVTRKIEMKRNPSRHECDARCINATGKVMRCECSCGGKNHGHGAFSCEAV